ncbi:MAG: GNAT family N-acetyltransferase [Roseovarius confluentis]|jgi:GNAT superfamily N-acetyltransferase|uniref:GNAT family N-acetyltransferase n=1 Tax=Roseovarius confluentis TaxID=1852027 RepID=UPI000CDD8150|nr:GNAT family N-acetyltransferase [Roseovarius confluentis]
MIRFREAGQADVAAVVALLTDDMLGQGREGAEPALYEAAFARMRNEGNNHLIVGEDEAGRIVATYQITFISGLSLRAARRAQVESVRVAGVKRGQGVGEAMFEDVKARARAAGCTLVQLTMNATRNDANRFYERIGFVASHTGFKLTLD